MMTNQKEYIITEEPRQIYMPKLSEGWLYIPISSETWELLSHFGNQENTPDEGLKQALKIALYNNSKESSEKVLDELEQHLWTDLKFSDEHRDQNMSDMESPAFRYYAARSATLEHVLDKIAELRQE